MNYREIPGLILETFAQRHRLKVSKNVCGEAIIQGKAGQIYEYSESLLGIMYMPGEWKPKTWAKARRKAQALGMILRQDGDSEGCLSFDPDNREQAKLAIKIAAVRAKRQLSPEQAALRAAWLANARQVRLNGRNLTVEGQNPL